MWIEDSRGSLAVKGDAFVATIKKDDSPDEAASSEHGKKEITIDEQNMDVKVPDQHDIDAKALTTNVIVVPARLRKNQPRRGRTLTIVKEIASGGWRNVGPTLPSPFI